ncbi:hypothetical protein L2E82_45044 [Cichorium intybus]|uniref:Uncharacterized protein n=1 Tax=Cichorium intybus TaxID=13427 RepID=A0ACB8ZRT4_CICIN|nr:hypothetical protein L2E82_45044 [Cichorium intybus]
MFHQISARERDSHVIRLRRTPLKCETSQIPFSCESTRTTEFDLALGFGLYDDDAEKVPDDEEECFVFFAREVKNLFTTATPKEATDKGQSAATNQSLARCRHERGHVNRGSGGDDKENGRRGERENKPEAVGSNPNRRLGAARRWSRWMRGG